MKEEKRFVDVVTKKKKNGLTLVKWKNTKETLHSVPDVKVVPYLGHMERILTRSYDKVLHTNVFRFLSSLSVHVLVHMYVVFLFTMLIAQVQVLEAQASCVDRRGFRQELWLCFSCGRRAPLRDGTCYA